ncbi:MAG: BspA family leucine-rich repeat surface protein [Prevotellaceae bacterium]|nr:BspA family leucine-rich repeat surface protein [Prevotellaceae bacterium]
MFFALISFLFAPPQRAQAQTREAYVSQSADETTLTFYYDDQRATRTGTTWVIKETEKRSGGTFPAWAGTDHVANSTTTRVVFDASFRDFRPTTTAMWFLNCKDLRKIGGLEYLNTSEVKDMGEMFSGCSRLTSLDLSHFNTQNVTDMRAMFQDCRRLTSLDLSHFNTQNVTDMSGMFFRCSGLPSLDLSHFNTQNVTDMRGMFAHCSGLTSLGLKNFNTQNVTSMNEMFWGCSGLTSLDLKNFNTQKVTHMDYMFSGCSALTFIRCNTDWQCPASEDMFARCTKLKGAVAYDENKTDATMANPETGYFTRSNDGVVEAYVVESADQTTLTFYYDALRAIRTGTTWGIEETKKEGDATFPAWAGTVANETTTRVVFDVSFRDFRSTTTAQWFTHCKMLSQIDGLEYLNTSEVKDMSGMFSRCSDLPYLDLSHFDTKNVTDMGGMFDGCWRLTSLDLSHFNTQNVTDMSGMFYDCRRLTSLDLSQFSTQNVTDMSGMFSYCYRLASLDLLHFNTQNVTAMRNMFYCCYRLTSLDLSHFNTQNVTDMIRMFSRCSGLTSLDLSHFNTQNVTSMSEMFSDCSGLTSLDVKNFNTQKVTDMISMFKGCSALTTINSNTAWQCPESDEMFAGCTLLKGAVAYDKYKTDVTMANPETGYFTAKPTAVESVRFGADDAQQIYTLQGKRVRGAWKHLPAGVYVVNGKKTIKP